MTPESNRVLDQALEAYKEDRLLDAEDLCQRAFGSQPGLSDQDLLRALHLLAAVQSRLGKKAAALTHYDRLLELRPAFAWAHVERGTVLSDLKRYDEALASFDRAIQLRPDYALAFANRGSVFYEQGRLQEALAAYDQAIALRPSFAVAFFNRANVLQDLKHYELALQSYDRAIALLPQLAEAHSNRGNVLLLMKRHAEAVASYNRALEIRPDFAEALGNRGAALHCLGRHEEARTSCDLALALLPTFPGALVNRGLAREQLGQFEEALADYCRAIELRPYHPEAHYAEALCRLLLGQFERGWEKNEWRWQADQLREARRSFRQPLWAGEDIAGKTILLHAEQGFGDTVQFCRYAPLVAARGARVILEVEEPLTELIRSLEGPTQVISRGTELPHFDWQCPLLSLPRAFGTTLETIPAATPYLSPTPQAVLDWGARLGPRLRPRIGLAWSGRPTHPNDHNRSISLSALLALLKMPEVTFVSLQKYVRTQDIATLNERTDLQHFGDELKTFDDTAAVISHLDAVISVDTSIVHVAGALAKPIWVLLPFVPDYRWLLGRDDSPWYPSARLFRQDQTRAWEPVLARVREALRDLVQQETGIRPII